MALINCPECGGKISDTVKSCIHCGYNLNPPAQNKTQDSFSKSVEEWKSVDDIRVALKKLMNYKGFVSISIDDYYVQVANNGAESEELTFEAVSGDYIPAIGNKDKEFDALGFGHDSGENYRKYLAFDEFSADTVIKEVKLIFESIYNKDFSSYEIETDFEERLAKSDSGAHQKKPNVFSKKTDKNGNEILAKINKAIEDNERLNSFKEWYSKDTDWNAKGISKLEKVDRLKHSFLKTVFIMVSGFVLMALFFWLLPYLILLGVSLVVGHYFGKFYGWSLGIIGALILITGGFSSDVDACRCVEVFEADMTGKSGSYWSPQDVRECESHYLRVALERNKQEYWCAVDDCNNSKK